MREGGWRHRGHARRLRQSEQAVNRSTQQLGRLPESRADELGDRSVPEGIARKRPIDLRQ
jgi:hypothetical protein